MEDPRANMTSHIEREELAKGQIPSPGGAVVIEGANIRLRHGEYVVGFLL